MKYTFNYRTHALFCALFFLASSCLSEEIQRQDEILAKAQEALEQQVLTTHGRAGEVRMGRLDPRLRLAACSGNLEAFMPPGSRILGNTTVGVRCTAPAGWSVYVSARVALYGEVLVTTQPLARGEPVTASTVRLVKRDLATLSRGYFEDTQPVIGQLARRMLSANTVLNPLMIESPKLVKRGERVILITGKPGFMVRSSGQALADGSSGDLIRIKSNGSKRVVEGRVVSQGVVKVTL